MGANEERPYTYDYTPNAGMVRSHWVYNRLRVDGVPVKESRAAFKRWLDKIRAEAKAEAYKDAERILHEEARWQLDLHQRHKEYRFKHCSERMTEMENCMATRANQYKENQK